MAEQAFRITYATMSADNEELQRNYDEAADRARDRLGKEYPFVVNGEDRWTDEKYEEPSPIDSNIVIGRFSQAGPKDVEDAVAAAKSSALGWDRLGWQERVRIRRNVADVMEDRLFDLAALMAYEVGKNRLEALGEVVLARPDIHADLAGIRVLRRVAVDGVRHPALLANLLEKTRRSRAADDRVHE